MTDQPEAPKADPVWYGVCGHWTADWSKLKRSGVPPELAAVNPALAARLKGRAGIPVCPIDGAPGYHAAKTWWADVDAYEAEGNPGYRKTVEALELP